MAFLLHPMLCSVTHKFFVCNIPGPNDSIFLNADVSIECWSDGWWVIARVVSMLREEFFCHTHGRFHCFRWSWFGPAVFFLVVFCFGIPLFFFFVLYKNKRILCPNPCPNAYKCTDVELVAKFGLLFQAYEPQFWWYEFVQM